MNTEQLKQAALKATPGPWEAQLDETYNVLGPDGGRVAMMMNLKGAHGMAGRRTGEESAANCRMIAAANPATILALLECVDALREWHEVHPNKDKKPGWVDREMNAQARCAKALQKLEAL